MKDRKTKLLVIATIASTIIYMLWRIFFTIPIGYGYVSLIAALILLGAELMGLIEQIIHFTNSSGGVSPKMPKVDESTFPTVDVFIATYNEPIDLLYKTVNGCVNMRYPDKKKVKIFLCDDGGRDEVRQLADKFHINYLARDDHQGAKAGNLNNALKHSKGDLIVTFDADMIPMSDFLVSTVPYFVPDLLNAKNLEDTKGIKARKKRKGKIGFLQTPQSFYNLDLFQYNLFSENNIPNEQDYFYRDIQISKNKGNAVIYGGSNTVLSREALEEIGGFVTSVITEDFATGMLIQAQGYQCFATEKVHASGLSPEDLKNLVKQRRRWARGCIQTGKKLKILFRKDLTLKQKIMYTSSISYWYDSVKRLIYMFSPILFSVFGIIIFVGNPLHLLVFWLPMYLLNSITIRRLSGNIRTLRWTNIYETIMFPFLVGAVIKEIFGMSEVSFAVTDKGSVSHDKHYQRKAAIPHILLTLFTVFGILHCIYLIFLTENISLLFLVFWLSLNLYNLIMALMFMLGREVHRKSPRFHIEADCVISYNNQKINCKTYDLSEGGFSVVAKYPEYMPPEENAKITISTKQYTARMSANIVQVVQIGNGFKYAFKVTDITEDNYRQLLNILYDRVPPLTQQIQEGFGFYEDLRTNIRKRNERHLNYNRKLPRVFMNKEVEAADGEKMTLLSFDYRFAAMKLPKETAHNRYIKIALSKEVVLLLTFAKIINYYELPKEEADHMVVNLYEIQNYEEIAAQPETKKLLLAYNEAYQMQAKSEIKQDASKGNEKMFDELDQLD